MPRRRPRRLPLREPFVYLYRELPRIAAAEGDHEIRHLLRASAAPSLDGAQRVRPPAELAGPDRAGRPARLRLRLGGRAPLPGGVLPLLGARGLPGRGQPAHPAHSPGPRHHPAPHQPSHPGGRARGHPRSPERGPRGAGARRGPGAGGAAPLRRARAREARRVGGGRAGHDPGLHAHLVGMAREVLQLPRAQRGPQALPEAASALVGGLLQHRDHRQRRPVGHGRARLPVRLARRPRGRG